MNNILIPILSLLALSTASGQTTAIDGRSEQRLLKANISALTAIRAYGKHPNGTTHALADVAYCNLSEQRQLARAYVAMAPARGKHIEELQRRRVSVGLPTIDCAAFSLTVTSASMAKAERPMATAPK